MYACTHARAHTRASIFKFHHSHHHQTTRLPSSHRPHCSWVEVQGTCVCTCACVCVCVRLFERLYLCCMASVCRCVCVPIFGLKFRVLGWVYVVGLTPHSRVYLYFNCKLQHKSIEWRKRRLALILRDISRKRVKYLRAPLRKMTGKQRAVCLLRHTVYIHTLI